MKTCFKCLSPKPLSEFYRHHMMADGHLSKCKDCTRRDVKLARLARIDEVRDYDKQRAKLPHRKAYGKRFTKEWRREFRDRARAQVRTARAVQNGMIKPESVCEGCGREDLKLEKHHHDYTRPLVVMWLCKPCHAIADKIRRKFEAA